MINKWKERLGGNPKRSEDTYLIVAIAILVISLASVNAALPLVWFAVCMTINLLAVTIERNGGVR